jgi:hypothetical protein
MNNFVIPRPVSVGLILSYQCIAQCRHCIEACSPQRSADWISDSDIEACFSELNGQIVCSPWGANNVSANYGLHITGGEPFLNFERLCKTVELSQYYQVPSTYVETNCFWCTDNDSTEEKLRLLKSKGLKGIQISINPFYLEHIPFENTKRGVVLSQDVFGEKNVMVFQQEFFDHFKNLKLSKTMPYDEYLGIKSRDPYFEDVSTMLCGRATYKLRDYHQKRQAFHYLYKPCAFPQYLKNWHSHYDVYGNCILEHCAGISLGPWKEMNKMMLYGMDLDTFPILKYILQDDFSGLYDYAKSCGYRERSDGYISKCDLCLDMRLFFVTFRQSYAELQPKEFYYQVAAQN